MQRRNTVAVAMQLLMMLTCVCAPSVSAQTGGGEAAEVRPAPDAAAAPSGASPAPLPTSDVPAPAPSVPNPQSPAPASSDAPPSGEVSGGARVGALGAALPADVEPVLALNADANVVDPAALAAALSRELGVAVTVRAALRDVIPTLTVGRARSGNVEVGLASRSLPRASREIVLQGTAEEQVETVALIAANLVRNEAASLLPDLRPRIAGEGVAPPKPPEAPVVVEPQDSMCGRGDEAFGIDFAPFVGSSSSKYGRAAVRRMSLGFAGTYSGGLDGFELSIGANIKRRGACGIQLAAGANVVLGPVSGLQLAQVNFAAGFMRGAQLGVVDVANADARGLQLGVITATLGAFRGAHLGVLTYTGKGTRGIEGGVANINLGGQEGFQGGVLNLALGESSGFQGGVANVTVGGRQGFQGGVLNVDIGKTKGIQAGVVNISSGPMRGLQIGVLNYAEESDASIGLVSIVRRGRTSADLTYDIANSLSMFSLTHGSKYIHSILGVGVRPGGDDVARVAALYGFGARALSTERFRFDIDVLAVHLFDKDIGANTIVMPTVRANLTYRIIGGLGVSVAPSYQVLITDNPEVRTESIWGEQTFEEGQDSELRASGFPGLTLGVHYEFEHGRR